MAFGDAYFASIILFKNDVCNLTKCLCQLNLYIGNICLKTIFESKMFVDMISYKG